MGSAYFSKLAGCCLLTILLFSSTRAQLSGTYTIGNGGDFETFTLAANALTTQGVSAPVVLNVLDGTYNEQIEIGVISGSSELNTVTFRSQATDSSKVTLYYQANSAGNNWVVKLNTSGYMIWEHMTLWSGGTTYSRVIHLDGNCSHITVRNCRFISDSNTGGVDRSLICAPGNQVTDLLVEMNRFSGGSFGVELNLQGYGSNTIIRNNQFVDCYGAVKLIRQQSVVISGNSVQNASRYGFDLQECDGELMILNNRVDVKEMYPLSLYNCTGGAPPLYDPALVANNFFHVQNGESSYGIRMSGSTFFNIYHNNVQVRGSSSLYTRALDISGGSNIRVLNNILASENDGYALYVQAPSALTTCDYNDLYTPGNYIAFWNGNISTLDSLVQFSGMNQHSVSAYPFFGPDGDLHTAAPWLDGKGTGISGIPDLLRDIDDETRSTPPDLGAAEFSPDAGMAIPMSGTYFIGVNPYRTFNDAVAELVLRGISGPVLFDVFNGTFNEQVELLEVPGASAVNTITFRSHGQDAGYAIVYHGAPDAGHNYTVRLKGADHIRFTKLTLRANSSSAATWGRVLDLFGGCDDIEVTDCQLIGSPVLNSAVQELAVVYSLYSVYTKRLFRNNLIQNGSSGFYDYRATVSELSTGLIVEDNRFRDNHTGLSLTRNLKSEIRGNIFSGIRNTGIQLERQYDRFILEKNQVYVPNGLYGIRLSNCEGGLEPLSSNALIANNFVWTGGTNTSYALDVISSQRLNIIHNSAMTTGTSVTTGRALNQNSGTDLYLFNNIFANMGGGYAAYIAAPAAIDISDYNDLFTTGTVLAYWDGNQANLTSLRTASGQETHSVSLNPEFTANDDLHTFCAAIDSAALFRTEVTDDIDGEPRDQQYPDIGADEFFSEAGLPFIRAAGLSLTGYSFCNTSWIDYDRDGDLDFLISGTDGISPYSTCLYRNDGNAFNEIATGMTGLYQASMAWGDYDNDGDPDVVLSGENAAGSPVTLMYNNNNGVFVVQNVSLAQLKRSSVAWGDYDLDGDLDLAVCGATGSFPTLQPHSHLYRNNGDRTFTEINAGFKGIYGGAAEWGDYDHDGDPDLLLVGAGRALIYKNFGREVFLEIDPGLPALQEVDAAWGDYDADGDMDIALCGMSGNQEVTTVYRNDGNDIFTDINGPFAGTVMGSLAWGDYDNNGYPDLLVCGEEETDAVCRIYRNTAGVFTLFDPGLPGIVYGKSRWGDWDNDGDLDILMSGLEGATGTRLTRIYNNNTATANSHPGTPGGLSAVPSANQATLYWQYAGDNETPAGGLTYNLRIGITPGGDEIMSGHATEGGRRLIPAAGNAGHTNHWNIFGLEAGTAYYWAVQTIDNAFAASVWAQGTFTTEQIRFVDIGANLPGVWAGSVDWGDADNDGDLDLAMCGQPGYSADSTVLTDMITKIFINDGNDHFTEKAVNIPGLMEGSVKWIDFDRDGDLDLFAAGWCGQVDNNQNARHLGLYQNDGAGNFSVRYEASDNKYRPNFTSAAIGDFEMDGDYDLLLSGLIPVWKYGWEYEWKYSPVLFYGDGGVGISADYFISGFDHGHYSICDYDNDGDIEIFATGRTGDVYQSKIIEFNTGYSGGFQLSTIETVIPGFNWGSAAWNDFDGDGDEDVLLSGFVTVDSIRSTQLYRNEQGSFTLVNTSLPPLSETAIAWGDCDSDGDADVALAGFDGNHHVCRVFRNDGPGGAGSWNFTDVTGGIEQAAGYSNSSVAWADYDQDFDLDLIVLGHNGTQNITRIYENQNASGDLPPGSPTGLAETLDDQFVYLHWIAPIDDRTVSPSLTYNVRIGRTPGGTEICAPMTNAYGYQKTAAPGQAHYGTTLKLSRRILDVGETIYWSVQAVDQGFKGSLFAPEKMYTIPVPVSVDTTFKYISTALPATINGDIEWVDLDNDGLLDVVVCGIDIHWQYISKIYYNRGGNEESWTYIPESSELTGVSSASIAPGDFDNDNDIDLLITGKTYSDERTTILYRNDRVENSTERIFTPVITELPGISSGMAAWGDYDQDGALDLLLCGSTDMGKIARIYRNGGASGVGRWEFKAVDIAASGVDQSSCSWVDMDNDLDQDVIIKGKTVTNDFSTQIFINKGHNPNGGWQFIPLNHNLPATDFIGNFCTGDFNNDTFVDIVNPESDKITVYFHPGEISNDMLLTFNPVVIFRAEEGIVRNVFTGDFDNNGLPDISYGGKIIYFYEVTEGITFRVSIPYLLTYFRDNAITVGDFDRDHKLDMLCTGSNNSYYNEARLSLNKNLIPSINNPPQAPPDLNAHVTGNSAHLTWAAPTDDHTPSSGLTYNVRIGTASGGCDVVSHTGFWIGVRKIPKFTNAGSKTGFQINNLQPNTTYFWSVQAIDHTFDGSVFAMEDSFMTASVEPKILSVTDVPFDCGGKVQVVWQACAFDTALDLIPEYSVWRGTTGTFSGLSKASVEDSKMNLNLRKSQTGQYHGKTIYWEWMGNQPAHKIPYYAFTCPTLYDSGAINAGETRHYFLVSAHTPDMAIFYDSDVDSSYSVNNLESSGIPLPKSGKALKTAARQNTSPVLLSVTDIPGDNGGRVKVSWQASSLDSGTFAIARYTVWRALPDNMLAWEMIAEQSAHHFPGYSITVPSLYDSIARTPALHFYMVSAHTRDHNIFYDSDPVSGFSRDDLAPAAPEMLQGEVQSDRIFLHWRPNREDDLKLYLVFHSSDPGFNPAEDQPLSVVRDTLFTDEEPFTGDNYYRIFAMDIHNNLSTSSNLLRITGPVLVRDGIGIPDTYMLYQNYPNPFNPYTTIAFDLPESEHVQLAVFNLLGQQLAEILNEFLPPGRYRYYWRPERLASGIYVYQIKTGRYTKVMKMLLVK